MCAMQGWLSPLHHSQLHVSTCFWLILSPHQFHGIWSTTQLTICFHHWASLQSVISAEYANLEWTVLTVTIRFLNKLYLLYFCFTRSFLLSKLSCFSVIVTIMIISSEWFTGWNGILRKKWNWSFTISHGKSLRISIPWIFWIHYLRSSYIRSTTSF